MRERTTITNAGSSIEDVRRYLDLHATLDFQDPEPERPALPMAFDGQTSDVSANNDAQTLGRPNIDTESVITSPELSLAEDPLASEANAFNNDWQSPSMATPRPWEHDLGACGFTLFASGLFDNFEGTLMQDPFGADYWGEGQETPYLGDLQMHESLDLFSERTIAQAAIVE